MNRIIMPVLLAGALLACSNSHSSMQQSEAQAPVTGRTIEDVLAAHNDELMALPGVVGTAIGVCNRGNRCIKVLVQDASVAAKSKLPAELEGYRVVAEVAGTILPR